MFRDPIVEEIRKYREAHAAEFNYDIAAICADIRRSEAESGRTYVSFGPKFIGEPMTEEELIARIEAVSERAKLAK